MPLSNILLRLKNKIIFLILPLFFLCILSLPYLLKIRSVVYFSIDPDAVYLANSLSLVKSKIIYYHDHPGTTSIYLFYIYMFPLRFFTSGDFIEFVYKNLDLVILYIRFIQSGLFYAGVVFFVFSLKYITKRILLVISGLLFLMSFTPIYYIVFSISAETLNFFMSCLWLYLFGLILEKNKIRYNKYFLVNISYFLSGIIFANRATSIVSILTSMALIIKYKRKVVESIYLIFLGYVVGVLPDIQNIFVILKRVLFFANSAGVHGELNGNFLILSNYLQSFLTYTNRDLVFVVLLLLVVYYLFVNRKKFTAEINILALFSCIASIVFIKFPLAHYQISNYLSLVFVFIYFIRDYSKLITNCTITLLLFSSLYFYINNFKNIQTELNQIEKQSNFINISFADSRRLFGWSRTHEFTKLWINDASGGLFNKYLENYENFAMYNSKNINKCWDIAYIQKSEISNFQEAELIEGSQNLYLVKNLEFEKCRNSHFK